METLLQEAKPRFRAPDIRNGVEYLFCLQTFIDDFGLPPLLPAGVAGAPVGQLADPSSLPIYLLRIFDANNTLLPIFSSLRSPVRMSVLCMQFHQPMNLFCPCLERRKLLLLITLPVRLLSACTGFPIKTPNLKSIFPIILPWLSSLSSSEYMFQFRETDLLFGKPLYACGMF